MINEDYLNGLRSAFVGKNTDTKIKSDSEYLDLMTTIILEYSERFRIREDKYPVDIQSLENPFQIQYKKLLIEFRDFVFEATGAYMTSYEALQSVYENVSNEVYIDRLYLNNVTISDVYNNMSDILDNVRDINTVMRIMKSLYEVLTSDVNDMECLSFHVHRLERLIRENHKIVYGLD